MHLRPRLCPQRAQTPMGQHTALPKPSKWWQGGLLPLTQEPLSALDTVGLTGVRSINVYFPGIRTLRNSYGMTVFITKLSIPKI